MAKKTQYSWDDTKVVDDVDYAEQDEAAFRQLLEPASDGSGEDKFLFNPGKILVGRIVEITKDHVVVDVGLKSEGVVSISEFSDQSQLVLDAQVEVYLDQAEDDRGFHRKCLQIRSRTAYH